MSYEPLDFSQEDLPWGLREVKEMFGDGIPEGCRQIGGRLVNWGIAMEFREYLGAFRFERNQSRRGWRNGYRS